jgi:hypothetical protein
MKTVIRAHIFLLILICFLIPVIGCDTPEEEPVEIASCSLEQVIEAAIERSPECRLQVPGVMTTGG